MAVGNPTFPRMHPVSGFALGTTAAGVRYADRRDLVVMACAEGSSVAALFTRNAFSAAPVRLGQAHLATAVPRYLVVNTGNANAGTGPQGERDALAVCQRLAHLGECQPQQVLPFSTGVIGEPLPLDPILNGLPDALATLSEMGWEEAAWGILTTDTIPKGVSRQVEIDGRLITLTGIAKGSGMIHPDMATMLAFIATDAAIDPELLQQLLVEATATSFNRVTVDGDTSTNDSLVAVATGAAGGRIWEDRNHPAVIEFAALLNETTQELAQLMVRDGEGATKFVTLEVEEAATAEEALQVAFTVAHSPLVKTALYASDPNWGRILAAVGRSGVERLEVDAIRIWLDEVLIVEQGGRAADYTEVQGQRVMDREEITIRVALGRGECQERVWTSDLSHDYVKINAEYRS